MKLLILLIKFEFLWLKLYLETIVVAHTFSKWEREKREKREREWARNGGSKNMITTDCCQGKRERQKKKGIKKDCTLFNTAISNVFNK